MPFIEYVPTNFHPGSLYIIGKANQIINDWTAKGYRLTLRQIYYRFIALDWLPVSWVDAEYNKKHGLHPSTKNTLKNYKKLGQILNTARLSGAVDWDSIEDMTRNLKGLQHFDSPATAVQWLAEQYRIEKWRDQPRRVEVWIEKDALAGIFERVCCEADIDVPYFSCRGYNSQSEMWAAAQRILAHEARGQQTAILQFSDHDPSGLDMTRDIKDRLALFGTSAKVARLALNIAQVKKLNLPPNPAKETDIRFANYAAEFGPESWELDALEPDMLADLVRRAVHKLRDQKTWEEALEEESKQVRELEAYGGVERRATGGYFKGAWIKYQ